MRLHPGNPGITYNHIEEYLYSLIPPRDEVLSGLEREATERGIPIVGPLVGGLLFILAKSRRARRVLEIGTAIGYSSIWLARAVREFKGHILTLEIDEGMAKEAMKNIKRAGLSGAVEVRCGDALEVVPELRGSYDLIFLDDGKEDYPTFLRLCLPRLKRGGMLVADNCLWGGTVASGDLSPAAQAIREFNRLITSHPDLETVILPVRDGLSISLKSNDLSKAIRIFLKPIMSPLLSWP